jgi:uncharacterized protein (TIGR03382 family)
VAGAVVVDQAAGTVDIPVSMPVCPAVLEPLSVRARVSGQYLREDDGGVREVAVEPRCDVRVENVGCGCASGAGAPLLVAVLAALRRPRRSAS